MSCLPGLTKIVQNGNVQDINPHEFSKSVINKLWKLQKEEKDPGMMSDYLYYLQKQFKYSGPVLTEQELQFFYKECQDQIINSEKRKAELHEQYDVDEENAEDLKTILRNDQSIENDLRLEIANLFGVIFQTHQQVSLKFQQQIHSDYIVPSMQHSTSDESLAEFGLFLISDSIEHIGQYLSQETIMNYYQCIKTFALHPKENLRQTAVFSLGTLCQVLGLNFKPFFKESVQIITQGLQLPKSSEQVSIVYRTCRENTASALAKIMKIFWQSLQA